jgi:xanthine dehydrogenase accessory factor
MQNAVYQAILDAERRGERVVLGILTGVKGSSPQKVGAKALFHADGRIQGTLGGGCLEAEVQQRAMQSLHTGQPATFELLLDHDFGWDDGLICGGKVFGLILPNAVASSLWSDLAARQRSITWGVKKDFSIAVASERSSAAENWYYQETVSPPCALWVAGAGHIAQAVAPMAGTLDFAVTVFDDRPALANHQFFPREVRLQVGDWDKLLAEPLPSVPTFGLIVTRGHRHDALVLRQWIQRPFVFLGMIGSQRKARTIFEHFVEEGIASKDQLHRVACPVGLSIQAVSVHEIAVSILAQFIEKRAAHLRERPAARSELVAT